MFMQQLPKPGPGAREELRHGDGRSEPHGALGAVLVAVEVTAGAAQRVVLDDDAEVRAGRAFPIARHEGRLETRDARLHVEPVCAEIVGEDPDRALLLPAGFRMTRDVIGHRQQLPVHEVPGPGDHGVAPRIACPREPRDELRQSERALELVHPANHLGRRGFLGRRLLGRGGGGSDEQDDGRDETGVSHQHLGAKGGSEKLPARRSDASARLLPGTSAASYLGP